MRAWRHRDLVPKLDGLVPAGERGRTGYRGDEAQRDSDRRAPSFFARPVCRKLERHGAGGSRSRREARRDHTLRRVSRVAAAECSPWRAIPCSRTRVVHETRSDHSRIPRIARSPRRRCCSAPARSEIIRASLDLAHQFNLLIMIVLRMKTNLGQSPHYSVLKCECNRIEQRCSRVSFHHAPTIQPQRAAQCSICGTCCPARMRYFRPSESTKHVIETALAAHQSKKPVVEITVLSRSFIVHRLPGTGTEKNHRWLKPYAHGNEC